ncbi:Stk1 family PASTA domain-containing Ser/Thr kinase [Cohnella sp. CFH 77786]|uniref:Stk1 family PASTA domain-containing Ser/Thr kinase n=1 Tax=Cohnella sp. CFH 77786 TaxID=2662265 RepID=UPI001C608D08|nr:Stk1 family PASTA domain-containing Ser/Thr kinase [Cohnella sp. CFH 77786]MBW5444667.1 Stk1 family PASTA domain-containing Ser/Thr kinase [Cohnella sp. CFH 77786]
MIGQTLGNRYELLARVGGGGMALVYKARDNLLNRYVAVKVLRQQFVHDDDFVRRFRREAQAAASLSHPNIVSIYDVGQEEDTHYIVMEFVDGANLNEIIRERAPLQTDEAVKIASQICDALDHAHLNQIIHRDIKPHNILIGYNGRVKVTDFGIARAATSSTITQTGSVVGSVHYFSPEHAKGVATGEKSDIYSLGIVLYQMLTGRLPFLGESPISVALKHLQEPFEQPRKVNPHIPQSVENVILRAMRKNPQERYASAAQMLSDLETCLQPQRLNEPPVHFGSDDDPESDKTRVIPAIRPDMRNTIEAPAIKGGAAEERWDNRGLEDKPRRRWVLPTVLGIMAAVLIGVLVWAVIALKGSLTPPDVMVPSVIHMKLDEARAKLESVGLKVEEPPLYEVNKEVEPNTVLKQSKQDIKVKEGSLITLTVSKAPDLPPMPGLKGLTLEESSSKLEELGVNPDNIRPKEVFDDSEPGTVLDQKPAEGDPFDPENDAITLTVSKGKEEIDMPNLIGKTEAEARAELEKNNLKLKDDKVITEPSYMAEKGKVFKQFPAEPNEKVPPGTEVTLYVSSGYPPDAKEPTWNVTVSPAQEGQQSTIKIVVSDAKGDNRDYWDAPRKISQTTTFPVTLVLGPGKDGTIIVYRDGKEIARTPVPYEDMPADATDAAGGTDATTDASGSDQPPAGDGGQTDGQTGGQGNGQ